MRPSFLWILCVLQLGSCAQNEEAERHCREFLTNPTTAPISQSAKRELLDDLEAEKWCDLVLADADLPLNIRGMFKPAYPIFFFLMLTIAFPRCVFFLC